MSYTDAEGKAQKLKASQVNIDATRLHAANKGVVTRPGALNFIDLGPAPAAMPVFRPVGKPRQASSTVRKQQPAAQEYIETNKSVTMYSTTWCPQCKRAKAWLNAHGVSYQTVEIDLMSEAEQARANAELRRMTGSVGYPTILIGKSIMMGYDPARMTTLLTSR